MIIISSVPKLPLVWPRDMSVVLSFHSFQVSPWRAKSGALCPKEYNLIITRVTQLTHLLR